MSGIFGAMSWKDAVALVVDVAIVYYVIYRVLLLLKGTRAAQLLMGLIVVGGGFFLAKALHLATVSWLLDNLVSYGILLVIIVFQQDIRRVLLRGARSLLGAGRTRDPAALCEEIVAATRELAHERATVTIVLEQKSDLSPLIESGWEVDARLCRESLLALAHGGPGGVILVSGERIARAGCLLSLEVLAARTDGIAIVIDLAGITVHAERRVLRNLDETALRKLLLLHLLPPAPQAGSSDRGPTRVIDAGAESR
jgi:diadenylate cyclase